MIERTYNVPLRRGFINKAKHAKTKKAVTVLREFLQRHMKSEKIKIGKNLNKFLWKHGIKNPPHHVKVYVVKSDDGIVKAELLGFKYEHLNKEQKEKLKDKKPERKKEEKKESVKEVKEDAPEEEKKPETEAKNEEKPEGQKIEHEVPAEKKEETSVKPAAAVKPKRRKKAVKKSAE